MEDVIELQVQKPGGSFKTPSIMLFLGGNNVCIPITKKKMDEIFENFPDIAWEG